jgi:hypothetical protein
MGKFAHIHLRKHSHYSPEEAETVATVIYKAKSRGSGRTLDSVLFRPHGSADDEYLDKLGDDKFRKSPGALLMLAPFLIAAAASELIELLEPFKVRVGASSHRSFAKSTGFPGMLQISSTAQPNRALHISADTPRKIPLWVSIFKSNQDSP